MMRKLSLCAVALLINGCAYQLACPPQGSCSSEGIYAGSNEQGGSARMKRIAAKGAVDGSADPSVSTQQPMR